MSGESDSHETASSRVTRFRGHCLHPAETVTGDIYRHLLKGSFNWQVSDYVRGQPAEEIRSYQLSGQCSLLSLGSTSGCSRQ